MNRQKIIDNIPTYYNPIFHAIIPSLIGIVIVIICSFKISHLTFTNLLSIPFILFSLFWFEWFVHKNILHKRQIFPLSEIYKLHILHHLIYTNKNMEMKNKREIYFIMVPFYAILLAFCLVLPISFGIGYIISSNVAYLIVIISMLFFLLYEWFHLFYHLQPTTFIGRLWLIKKLRALHQTHHNPKLMKQWNFNVSFPVLDLIMKTYYKSESGL